MTGVTDILKAWTSQLADYVEIAAAVIIALAAIEATLHALTLFVRRNLPPEAKENVRLRLGRWLAVALEFELAADILRTAIAPTWTQIGQLAAIIVLRTLLNYFLQQEIDKAARRQQATPASGPTAERTPAPEGATTLGTQRTTPGWADAMRAIMRSSAPSHGAEGAPADAPAGEPTRV